MLPPEVYIGPIKLYFSYVRVGNQNIIFIEHVDDYFSCVEVVDAQIAELEVEGFLPDGIVGLLANLCNGFLTAVLLV